MRYHKPSGHSTEHQYSAEDAHEQLSEDTTQQKALRKAGELAVEASDELLDEIDSILEVNELTATNFRQKGGE